MAVQELEQALTVLGLPGWRWRPIGFVRKLSVITRRLSSAMLGDGAGDGGSLPVNRTQYTAPHSIGEHRLLRYLARHSASDHVLNPNASHGQLRRLVHR